MVWLPEEILHSDLLSVHNNHLQDVYKRQPYGCIIDMDEGVSDDGIVVGTGPYVATELVTDDHLNLVKNENYWDGDVNIDEITVRTIADGDTLALALQSGEINACLLYTSMRQSARS